MTSAPATAVGGRAIGWLVLSGVVGAWWLFLAPAALGGPVTPIITRGISMEPTYTSGDLAIGYRDRSPAVGDVLVARHPSGAIVLHRVIGQDAAGFITQGDNLDQPDPWRTPPDEVIGTVRFSVAGAWRVLALLQEPLVLGALAGLAVLAVAGLSADVRLRPRTPPPGMASVIVVVAVLGILPGLTASLTVTSDQLLAVHLDHPAGLSPTYLVNGSGGNCPPRNPNC